MMDLLDLAQMENCSFKLNKEYFNITEIIKKAFGVVQHVANLKEVELVEVPVNEYEAMYLSAVYGDEGRIMQVLINFLSNSLKFSNKGGKVILNLKML